ncbi:MAG: response regulator, partial [Algicola sp.]|nr:response regulator [Algicola sp.]
LKVTQHGYVTIKGGVKPCVLPEPIEAPEAIELPKPIEQQTQPDQAMLVIEVIDTGIGMTPDQLNHVFDSFTQADGSTSRKFGGTGLGLSIVKELVRLMDGDINVISKADIGSTFKVSFKVTIESPEQVVFDYSSEPGNRLFYFCHDDHGFINGHYLAQVDPDYQQYQTAQLKDKLSQLTPNDVVLVDIVSKKHHDTIKSSLAELLDNGIKVGFVTDTQPHMLASKLTQKWQAPSIAHPFTGGQLMAFLLDVYPNKAQSDKQQETQTEQTEQYEGHILLVEDNNINQLVTGEILKLFGLTFDLAEDGQQAITKIVNSPHYDLVLMDIQMPVMDGYLATEQLRKLGYNDLIICGLSANAMKQDFDKAYACGMNDYVTKPIKVHELGEILDKYLPTRT